MKRFTILSLLLLTFASGPFTYSQPIANAESEESINLLTCDPLTSSFIIQGTSSLHDWEMISKSCKGNLIYNNEGSSIDLEKIELKVGVTTLKSGKKVMDRKCYDALKHEDNPDIVYSLIGINSIKGDSKETYKASLNGTLNVAGKIQTLDIDVIIEVKDGIMNIKGSKPLKMSDYDVEPPKALLGTLKTGNEITIIFNLNFVVL